MARVRVLVGVLMALVLVGSCIPPAGPAETTNTGPWRFAVFGDTRSSSVIAPVNVGAVGPIVQALVGEGVDLVLVPGDLVDGSPLGLGLQLNTWRVVAGPLYEAGIDVYPIRGNHEAVGGVAPWRNVFADLPQNGPEGEEGLSYSLVHNNALFVGFDQYVRSHRVNQEWLDGLLADPNRPAHVFVFGHEPAFPANHADTLATSPQDRDAFWNSLGSAGGGMYFCGHDHFYARSQVADAADRPVQQMIVGSGGAPFYAFHGYADPRVQPMANDTDHYGYLLVEIDGESVSVQYKAQLDPAQPAVFTTVDEFRYRVARDSGVVMVPARRGNG